MAYSSEGYIEYQPTVAPIEVGGRKIEFINIDPITFAASGLAESIKTAIDPRPEVVELEPAKLPIDHL